MNYKLYFQILCLIVAAVIFILIGFFLGRSNKQKGNVINLIINIFKFIINTEKLSLPGKINFCGAILILISSIITSIPNYFAFIYNTIFKGQVIKISESNANVIYIGGCALTISLVEALIRYKLKTNEIRNNARSETAVTDHRS